MDRTVDVARLNESGAGASVSVGRKRGRPRKDDDAGASLRRLSIGLSSRGVQRIEDLKSRTDAVASVDVVRNALRVYELLVLSEEAGKRIEIVDQDAPGRGVPVQLW